MRAMSVPTQSVLLRPEEMTHRIGRFYRGRPSWRTRLRSLRRRFGDASLPLSEEEELIEARKQILAAPWPKNKVREPVRALRMVHPLPPVLLAADGWTTFRYVKALKNASTSMINLLLEMTGEAAYHSRDAEETPTFVLPMRKIRLGDTDLPTAILINESLPMLHRCYMKARRFKSAPYADIRFCIVRDPVTRFLAGLNQLQLILWAGGETQPLTPAFIDTCLDDMMTFYTATHGRKKLKKTLHTLNLSGRHLFRQTWFLGRDANYYTHIFSTRRPQEFHDFLSQLAGKRLSSFATNNLVSRQKALRAHGPSLARPQLTAAQRRKVEDLYAEDYQVFGRWF